MAFLESGKTSCIQTAILGSTGILGQELIKAMGQSEILLQSLVCGHQSNLLWVHWK